MLPHVQSLYERKARRRWLAFIGAFFAFEFVLWGTAVYVVHDDPSHAVVEAYDARALAWDEEQRARRASKALGWTAQVAIGAGPDRAGTLEVTLADREGRPVAGASVEVTAFHRARAGRPHKVTLREAEPGTYRAPVQPVHPGRWVTEIRARRGKDLFLDRTEILAGGGGP